MAPSTPRFRLLRAAEGRRRGGHSAGGRSGRVTFSGLPCGQLGQELGDVRRAELRRDRGPGDRDHGVAVAGAHQVAAHRPQVLLQGLHEDRRRAGDAQLLGLAAEPAAGRAPEDERAPFARVDRPERVQGGGRVQADHEVELLGAQQVEVRRRVHAAVDVAAPGDLDRAVEARDRARGGDGVGELRRRRAVAAERDPGAGGVVAGRDPEAGVGRPSRSARPGAPARAAARWRSSRAAASRWRRSPGVKRCGRASVRSASAQEPGPIGGGQASSWKTAPPERSASAAGRPDASVIDSNVSPAECATMNHGGTPPASSAASIEPADVPTMISALAGSQPVSVASASRPPVSQAPPCTPPAPRTSPILTHSGYPGEPADRRRSHPPSVRIAGGPRRGCR